MKKRGSDKDFIILLVLTLITVISWVGLDVYRAYTRPQVPTGVEELLTPIQPVLNTEVLSNLENKTP